MEPSKLAPFFSFGRTPSRDHFKPEWKGIDPNGTALSAGFDTGFDTGLDGKAHERRRVFSFLLCGFAGRPSAALRENLVFGLSLLPR